MPTISATSAVSWRQEVPATNSRAKAIVTYTMPEPRSGWAITSVAGISAPSITRAVVSRSRRRLPRSTTYADSAMISSTLPSSEAWKEKNGRLIARCAPWAERPSANTAKMLRMSSAYRPYLRWRRRA